ncbi:hypothetical protein D9758_009322 [Tetrapyrgos nigripes]|uniref:FAD/NAD(P)-binding domain-containing protein n=1 Tax=Tetrapyrgos nigripes TaxID=182062 RepID=A0A8H5LPL7_9AGAR|nr:hypothetical protein D9758_009322 [Tetrapyrgos nigripes]
MSKTTDDKKTIVIVGGGTAGSLVARSLSKSLSPQSHNIILINPRPYAISLPATLRLVVSDQNDLASPQTGALLPYDKLFFSNNGRLVHASVSAVIQEPGHKNGRVKLSNGEEIEYDVLVLATGSKWGGAIDFPEGDEKVLMEYIKERREEFKKAKEVLIVGGGSVGVELAGEIKDVWPDKPVTILHRDTKLINSTYPGKYRDRLANQIKSRGVSLILNDSLDVDSENKISTIGEVQTYTTKGGKDVKADLVIRAYGSKPNTSFLSSPSSSTLSSFLTPSGTIKTLPTLQLAGFPHIFALGDIIEWKEQKQAAKASLGHSGVVINNIETYLSDLAGGEEKGKKLKEYKGFMEMIVVTNGKSSGLGYLDLLWGIVLPGWVAAMAKSKTLLVSKAREAQGY